MSSLDGDTRVGVVASMFQLDARSEMSLMLVFRGRFMGQVGLEMDAVWALERVGSWGFGRRAAMAAADMEVVFWGGRKGDSATRL